MGAVCKNVLTISFHAGIQTLLVAAELADIPGCRGDNTRPIPTALILVDVTLLYCSPEKTL